MIHKYELMVENRDRTNISMITKAMELLESLSKYPKGLTLQEIVGILDYPKSSIYKIATNLLDLGYIGREPDSLRYFLSHKLLLLGLTAVSSYDIIEKSEEYMKRLRDKVGESVMIGTLLDTEVVLIKQVQGNLDFVFTLQQGMRFNLHSTAPGKVLLAFMPEKDQREKLSEIHFEAHNEYTITEKGLLKKELDRIVTDGYAIDLNETVKGVHCIAAPIFDERGNAIACIWTSGPAGRLSEDKVRSVGLQTRNAGLEISQNIGYKHKLK